MTAVGGLVEGASDELMVSGYTTQSSYILSGLWSLLYLALLLHTLRTNDTLPAPESCAKGLERPRLGVMILNTRIRQEMSDSVSGFDFRKWRTPGALLSIEKPNTEARWKLAWEMFPGRGEASGGCFGFRSKKSLVPCTKFQHPGN